MGRANLQQAELAEHSPSLRGRVAPLLCYDESMPNISQYRFEGVEATPSHLYLSKAWPMTPAPQVVHHSLGGRIEVPSLCEHARRHRNLFPEERVSQTGVIRDLEEESIKRVGEVPRRYCSRVGVGRIKNCRYVARRTLRTKPAPLLCDSAYLCCPHEAEGGVAMLCI